MPRRARHLIPTQLPRRGEVVAAFAVLVLLAHLLFAQLTFVLTVVFADHAGSITPPPAGSAGSAGSAANP